MLLVIPGNPGSATSHTGKPGQCSKLYRATRAVLQVIQRNPASVKQYQASVKDTSGCLGALLGGSIRCRLARSDSGRWSRNDGDEEMGHRIWKLAGAAGCGGRSVT